MRDKRRNHEAGIALVLALLSLMLLTFLGLALAATTSTELQIANNYRWSQQAFYNAEAGLEAAKSVLAGIDDWGTILPGARTVAWDPNITHPPAGSPAAGIRDYENTACDTRGAGMGYGLVLRADVPYNNLTTVNLGGAPRSVRGAFTVWIRRLVVPATAATGPQGKLEMTGLYVDAEGNENIVVTSEGVAPFGGTASGVMVQQHQAVRTIEATFSRDTGLTGDECDFMDPEGAGFAKCFAGEDEGVGFTGDAEIR